MAPLKIPKNSFSTPGARALPIFKFVRGADAPDWINKVGNFLEEKLNPVVVDWTLEDSR